MTRILYWNVQDFSINKIANPSLDREPGTTITKAAASADRLQIMRGMVQAATPDIIVIVELETPFGGKGRLVAGNAPLASEQLLLAVRNVTGDGSWMMVPPLQTGRKEGVIVFYRSDNYSFCGPYSWPGGQGPSRPLQLPVAPYPAPFNNYLPQRNIPAGAPNAGFPEHLMAGKASGYTVRAGYDDAGGPLNFGGRSRDPFCVQFAEFTGAGVQRVLTVFGIHSPANALYAREYMDDLADCAEIVDGQLAGEIRVIVGDFNINLYNAAGVVDPRYVAMTAAPVNYELGIRVLGAPPPAPAGPPPTGFMFDGYYATHIKPRRSAKYWSTNGETQYYPGYGYIGARRIANFFAIDNVMARNFAGPVWPAAGPANVSILNGITGTPYHNLAGLYPAPAPPLNASPGYVPVPNLMNNAPFNAVPDRAPNHVAGVSQNFRNWYNYGRLRSTSDHLPIVAVV